MHIAIGCFRRVLPIFADFCRFLQNLAKFCEIWQNFRVNFPGSLGNFHILTQNLENIDPGDVFSPRECFFRFLAFFSSIWPNFRRFSGNLGRFRPASLFSRSISCIILKKHAMLLFCKTPTPHRNLTTLQHSPMIYREEFAHGSKAKNGRKTGCQGTDFDETLW